MDQRFCKINIQINIMQNLKEEFNYFATFQPVLTRDVPGMRLNRAGMGYLTKRFLTQNKIRRSDQKPRRFKKTFFSKTKDKLLLYFPKILVHIFQTSCGEYFRTFGKKNELYNKTPPKRPFLPKIDLTATGLMWHFMPNLHLKFSNFDSILHVGPQCHQFHLFFLTQGYSIHL